LATPKKFRVWIGELVLFLERLLAHPIPSISKCFLTNFHHLAPLFFLCTRSCIFFKSRNLALIRHKQKEGKKNIALQKVEGLKNQGNMNR
jgi:hypothetical protein